MATPRNINKGEQARYMILIKLSLESLIITMNTGRESISKCLNYTDVFHVYSSTNISLCRGKMDRIHDQIQQHISRSKTRDQMKVHVIIRIIAIIVSFGY